MAPHSCKIKSLCFRFFVIKTPSQKLWKIPKYAVLIYTVNPDFVKKHYKEFMNADWIYFKISNSKPQLVLTSLFISVSSLIALCSQM